MGQKMSKSSTTTRPATTRPAPVNRADLDPVHPGEILRAEFLEPLGLTPYALAKSLHVPRTRIERLVREETAMTPDTALRLGRYFRTTPEFWLALQARHDLDVVRRSCESDITAIEPRKAT